MSVPSWDNPRSLVCSPLQGKALRLVLIQAREFPQMVKQEQACFVERCRVPRDRFHVVNVVCGDRPTTELLESADAVLIGGAGAYSAAENYAWMPALLEFVRRTVDRELPLFGSCWGHQIIARALGGRVVYDPEHAELGCHWVEKTQAGRSDLLFHRFPQRFRANMGHHDRVVELPPGATELARNALPYQAFRLDDRPVYGTQFHSELDAERERERILVYREEYRDALPDEETVQNVLANLADTTAVDPLLYDFLTTYVGRRRAAPASVTAADLEPSRPLRPHPDGSGPPAEGRRVPGA